MLLWLHSAARNWQRHRFVTALLLAGYALGITLTTLVFAVIGGAAEHERDLAFGDPRRTLAASISGEKAIPLDLDAWLAGVPVSWGWVYLAGTGRRLDPALGQTNILALFGTGEVSWKPPMRSGRFLTGADLRQGQHVLVRGEEVTQIPKGFQAIGVAYDPPQARRGWARDVFVPFSTLPAEIKQKSETLVTIHLEVPEGQDPTKAKATIIQNLARQYPNSSINVETMADQYARMSERFREAYSRGFLFSAVILGFVAANVTVLSVHWVTQRRRELGVRMAFGATKGSIVAMVLTEHLLLAAIGGAIAVPIVLGVSRLAPMLDLPAEISVRMLLATLGAIVLGGILSSVAPLYLYFRVPLRENLQYRD